MIFKQEFIIEHDVFPRSEDGQITVFVCERGEAPVGNIVIRKFKSDCGNTLEVHITAKKRFIRCIKPLYDCQPNCQSCADRIEKIRKLIETENQTS